LAQLRALHETVAAQRERQMSELGYLIELGETSARDYLFYLSSCRRQPTGGLLRRRPQKAERHRG
jgi:hypothetical protein